MKIQTLLRAAGAFALLAAGCGDDNSTQDSGGTSDLTMVTPQPDMTTLPDLTPPADLTPIPPDMTVVYRPTILLEEVATVIAVNGMAVPVKGFTPVVIASDPAKSKPSDFDNSDALGLGCSANHYDATKGDLPTPDVDIGTVTMTGLTTGAAITGMMIPNEVNCALVPGPLPLYACGYGPLSNGAPSAAGVNSTFFPGNLEMLPAGTALRVKYTGGTVAGAFDSMDAVKATDTLTVMEDLTKIKYDPAADTVIHFSCVNKPQNCFDAVLVQLVASSVAPGMAGYPGGAGVDYGTINCAALANGGTITIPKDAIKAMYGDSQKIVSVMTRIVRGGLPPGGQKDAKGNPVRLALGRGLMAFAPK